MKKRTTALYDILGISSAAVCLVHCLVFPLLTILPLGLSHHPFIDVTFASIGLFAVFRIRRKATVLVGGILIGSMALVWIGILSEIILDVHSDLILIGGIGMIIGHLVNYRSHSKKNH
jgi:hypothetical protein